MADWQVTILVALIGQLPVFVTVIRVHSKVTAAGNGHHKEVLRSLAELERRLQNVEQELGVVEKAVLAERIAPKRKHRRKLLGLL